jgi:hypothetical protein
MDTIKYCTLFITLFIFCASSMQAEAQVKKLLIGKWSFEKFVFPNNRSTSENFISNANKTNKGLTDTFTSDNRYVSKQAGGLKVDNVTTWFRLLVTESI